MEAYELLYPEELAAAKAYMRVEGEEDDALVVDTVLAARTYLAGAGVTLPPAGSGKRALYDMACHCLALAYYERRSVDETAPEDSKAVQRIIEQLKKTEEADGSNADAGKGGENGDDQKS